MEIQAVEIPESLLVTACPNCGYSLAGLPGTSTCPECGRAYDPSEVVLHGWARGRHETIANTKQSRIAWVLLCGIAWMVPYSMNAIFAPREHLVIILILAALTVSLSAYQWFRRQDTAHPDLIQVRLNERGCVQYDDLSGSSVIREPLRAHGWTIPIAGAVALVVIFVRGLIGPIAFWFWLVWAVLIAIFSWKPCRRFRRSMREMREGSIADVNAAYRQSTPWNQIGKISLLPNSDESYRFRLTARFRILHHDVVDAEIRCTEQQAKQLRERIQAWQARARLLS